MKILMMVIVFVLAGCVDKESDKTVIDESNCSDYTDYNLEVWGETKMYTFTVNECNTIKYVQKFDEAKFGRVLVGVKKEVKAIEHHDKITTIYYLQDGLYFSGRGAEINGESVEYKYTHNYSDDYIAKEANGVIDHIFSHDDLYKSIMGDVLHKLVLVEVGDLGV